MERKLPVMERVLRRMERRSLVAGSAEALAAEAQDVRERLAEASAALRRLREVQQAVNKLTSDSGGKSGCRGRGGVQELLEEVKGVEGEFKDALERFRAGFARKKEEKKKVGRGYEKVGEKKEDHRKKLRTRGSKKEEEEKQEVVEKRVEKQFRQKVEDGKKRKAGKEFQVETKQKTQVKKKEVEEKMQDYSQDDSSETETEGRVEEEGESESSESEYEDIQVHKRPEVVVIDDSSGDESSDEERSDESDNEVTKAHDEVTCEQMLLVKVEDATSQPSEEPSSQRLDLSASIPEPQRFEDDDSPLWLSANSSESDEDFPAISQQEDDDQPAVPKGHSTTISSDSDSSDDSSESGEELDRGSLTTDYMRKLAESLGGSGDQPPEYAPVPGRQPLSRSHPARSQLLPLARTCLKRAGNSFSLEHTGWRDDVAIVRQLLSSIGDSKEDKEPLALVARIASKAIDQLNRRLRRADPALFTRFAIDGLLRSIKDACTTRPDVRQYLEKRVGEVGHTAMDLMSNERWRPDYPKYWSLALQADYVTPAKMSVWACQLVNALEEAFVWAIQNQPPANDLDRIVRATKLLILPLSDLTPPQLETVIEAADFRLFMWSIANFAKQVSNSNKEIAGKADQVAERLASVLDRAHAH